MKLGIFADVHGNIYAFDKIWKALQKESCDFYCFAGDICGYYYHQNEIIEALKEERNLICILGNHDEMFLRILNDSKLEKKYISEYGNSCTLLKKKIKPENLVFLENLSQKYIFDEYRIAIYHGSPLDNLNGYVYPTDSLDYFKELPYKFVILGHTHYPMNISIDNIMVINPGSCGQPRDFNLSSYAILDYGSRKVEFKRVKYDIDSLIKDVMKHREKNKYLIEVLKREKK